MKLIDEIIEILEEHKSDFISPFNKEAREFIKFSPKPQLNEKNIAPTANPLQHKEQKIAEVKKFNPEHPVQNNTSNDENISGYAKAQPVSQDISGMQLEQLRQFTLSCKKCVLSQGRTHVVFGEGNPNSEIMFIGEAPGMEEDLQGKPFVGQAGDLLTKMIKAMGYSRDDVYITQIVKCRPPYNRKPTPDEAKYCFDYLNRQIELVKPKVIVLLGGIALRFLLGKERITHLRGQWLEYRGIKTLPTFHPAFLLRNQTQKRPAWEDLQKVMRFLGKL